MFTGIIECFGVLKEKKAELSNLHLTLYSEITNELKIDQSLAHNGVCLTVVELDGDHYTVTAIQETLDRSNIDQIQIGEEVNLERCLRVGDRLDGHMVQGHVDSMAEVVKIEEEGGSTKYYFEYLKPEKLLTVEKGSICVNGVSLTVIDSKPEGFSVAIIPYTIEHTNFKNFKLGSQVNIEFDIIGKYILNQKNH